MKHTCQYKRRWLVTMLVILFVLDGYAQVQYTFKSIGIERENQNVLHNDAHLAAFFEHLYQQQKQIDRVINILHLGDSHVQGDYMTGVVRKNLQYYFGNAGRGFVFPYRVAGTNEPPNFTSSSKQIWNVRRVVHRDLALPLGLSGISIASGDSTAGFSLRVHDPDVDDAFTKVSLFFLSDANAYDVILADSARNILHNLRPNVTDGLHVASVVLADSTSSISVRSRKTKAHQNRSVFFGLNLENKLNGIRYHAIGVNGAKYELYNAAEYFFQQTTVLQPALVIIALGTNEAIAYPAMKKNFYQEVETLVSRIKSANPLASFLLVTPPDAFRNQDKHNPGVDMIRKDIIRFAVENGYCFYDMYKALGPASKWKRARLLRADGVHFTIEAYQYLGELFVDAFLKSYNHYVSNRRQ